MSTDSTPSSSFEIGDIYYALFRHKWKIILPTLAGLIAAAAYYKLQPPIYQSEARLFIRFIISEGRSVDPGVEKDAVTVSADSRGSTVINSEIQIFTSRDVSEIVARNLGPERILAKINGGRSLDEAASVVRGGLTVDVPPRSSIVRAVYQHPDPEMVQPILREIVATYLKRHQEIHRSPGMVGDFLASETDQLRTRLAGTEEELRKLNSRAGVVSLEASKAAFADQIAKLRQEIMAAQAELASRSAVYEQLVKTGAAVETPTDSAAPAPAPVIPPDKQDSYQRTVGRLVELQRYEQELLKQFTPEVPRVQEIKNQITQLAQQKQALEAEFPALLSVPVRTAPAASGSTPIDAFDPVTEATRITALQARIKILMQQLEQVRKEAATLDEQEVAIMELRRRKELEETNYRRYAAGLENSRIREALGDGKVSNINVVQAATPAFRDLTMIKKVSGGIAAGGFILGLAWMLVIEFYLDRSIRRPSDVERSLHVPLFLSIPKVKASRRLTRGDQKELPEPGKSPFAGSGSNQQLAVKRGGSSDLEVYYQTLRDRLISYFESLNIRHKPKLIAITGLGHGSGVTTTAAGLARSLSETGEGNVLLVDMTQGQGSAQHFHQGTPVGIDQLLDTRNSAFVRDNLYVVSEQSGSDRLAKGMPQRFNALVPKLKASDFDYIIFDMPPVNQISITPRLASFMDMVLMVVESEKTDRHVAKRAADLLAQSKTSVGVVLNKNKPYVPAALQQDREFLLGM